MSGGWVEWVGGAVADYLAKRYGPGVPDAFWGSVKLIHTDELRGWTSFPRYEEHDSPTYLEYRRQASRLKKLRGEVREALDALERIERWDHDGFERYETVEVPVGRSLLRRSVRLALPEPQHPQTQFEPAYGSISEGSLTVPAGWRRKTVRVTLSCPSRVLHREEIEERRRRLEGRPPEERAKLHEVRTSRFAHPVLFISHRWESAEHPDPRGTQLEKLSALRDCFVIYDYSSFPQDVSTDAKRDALRLVLANMGALIERVVVIRSDDYIERGWCFYEYAIASLKATVVCDEVRDPKFTALRQWSAMDAPAAASLKGHSFESGIANAINQNIFETVNRILPLYQGAGFTVADDRAIVTDLLIDELARQLPNRMEYPSPYLGEWVSKPWSREELAAAFTDDLKWERQHTTPIDPPELSVPATIGEAVERRYGIEKPRPNHHITQLVSKLFSFGKDSGDGMAH